MSAILDRGLDPERLAQCRACDAADAANDAALSATILQAVAPRTINLAHFITTELAKGLTEPTEMADMLEAIGDRVDSRFQGIPDTTDNQPLILVLYELGEALERARLKLVKLDALCEGVTL